MNEYEACEQAYRNGYAQGLKDRGEKTADEMFRELGYFKKYGHTYENKYGTKIWVDDRWVGHLTVHKVGVTYQSFLGAEIRAVCKLLDEMEVE